MFFLTIGSFSKHNRNPTSDLQTHHCSSKETKMAFIDKSIYNSLFFHSLLFRLITGFWKPRPFPTSLKSETSDVDANPAVSLLRPVSFKRSALISEALPRSIFNRMTAVS
ncbi:hypothetical protein AVEN_109980-1 [Araneus ventricosus]|uniref:Uncharacterized protein n=1 Tax=Araneus ventricosus TaxID=182803 RepID=A0A4Y2RB00_ARAVE|nr:hypothetical protein AVEN_231541-1 [Araneus ventricosus]GBN72596.1 hypothetical protein AVEN_109980-1 [Araneus ventricosus]